MTLKTSSWRNAYVLSLSLFMMFALTTHAQEPINRSLPDDAQVPEFVRMMRSERPRLNEVQKTYEGYYNTVIAPEKEAYRNNPATKDLKYKNQYEHAFKIWRSEVAGFLTPDGYVDYSKEAQRQREEIAARIHPASQARGSDQWFPVGPMQVVKSTSGKPISSQANVFDIAFSPYDPGVLYAATESGGLFKSVDASLTWYQIAMDYNLRNIRSVAYWPYNSDYVRMATTGNIYYSDDGGEHWLLCNIEPSGIPGDNISSTFQVHQLFFTNSNSNRAFAATSDGLFISEDYGKSWKEKGFINGGEVTSIVQNPLNPATLYMIMHYTDSRNAYVLRSYNSGDDWEIMSNGWFEIPSNDVNEFNVWGGRLATTPADTNRIYALLNEANSSGLSDLKTFGFVGLYRSDNSGDSWTRMNASIGWPYNNTTHPNLMSWGSFPGDGLPYAYNQVNYLNNAIAVSSVDADHVLVGALAMWESTDGASSWTGIGGYFSAVPDIHPDIRRIFFRPTAPGQEDLLWCSDGGINFSADGTLAAHEARSYGIFANEMWGFDMDKRQIIMGGGSYHNGDNIYAGNFPEGTWKNVVGGESATGAVQFGATPRLWVDDSTPKAVAFPDDYAAATQYYASILDQPEWKPNSALGLIQNRSSRILFDERNPRRIYWGSQSRFCRSDDDGRTAIVLSDFGQYGRVEWFDQSTNNQNVIYLKTEDENALNNGFDNTWSLLRTHDGGFTWDTIVARNPNNFKFTIHDDDKIYVAYDNSPDEAKIMASEDSGVTWFPISSVVLNGANINAIYSIPGYDVHLIVQTSFGGVFRWFNFGDSWENLGDGLNTGITAERIVYYAPERLLIMGTQGQGVWARPLQDSPTAMVVNFASDYDRNYCVGEPVQFYNRSNSSGDADIQWTFVNGFPGTSTEENPVVTFSIPGTWPVQIDVMESNGLTGTDGSPNYITVVGQSSVPYLETFENGINDQWIITDVNHNDNTWSLAPGLGAFGQSETSLRLNNFTEDELGWKDEIRLFKADLSSASNPMLTFDVAYAMYTDALPQRDSLQVLVSLDCGETFVRVYQKGGEDLATAPPTAAFFLPASSEWRTESIDLSGLTGNPDVWIAFRNVGHYDNALYIDNIGLDADMVGTKEDILNQHLIVSPNPNDGVFRVSFDMPLGTEGKMTLTDPLGHRVYTSTLDISSGKTDTTIRVEKMTPGIYILQLYGEGFHITHKVMILE